MDYFRRWNHFYVDMRPFKRSQNVRISWTLISCVLYYFSIHGQCQSNFLRLTEIQNSVFPPNSRIKQDLSYWSTCAKSNATILRNNQTCQLNVTISSDRATMAVKRCEPRSVCLDDKLLSALWTPPTHIRWHSNPNTPTPTLQPQHSNPNTPQEMDEAVAWALSLLLPSTQSGHQCSPCIQYCSNIFRQPSGCLNMNCVLCIYLSPAAWMNYQRPRRLLWQAGWNKLVSISALYMNCSRKTKWSLDRLH